MIKRHRNRAVSTVEYAMLIIIILGGLFLMRKQIARAVMGRWKAVGDSFGQGQQYAPGITQECGLYAARNTSGTGWSTETWYYQTCYECCMDTIASSCYRPEGNILQAALDVCRAKSTSDEKRKCCALACESSACD